MDFFIGDGNKVSMSYGKRVQLDSLFDARQPMSTVQSLEILLTPVLNNEQDLVNRFFFVKLILKFCLFLFLINFSRKQIYHNFQQHLQYILILQEKQLKC